MIIANSSGVFPEAVWASQFYVPLCVDDQVPCGRNFVGFAMDKALDSGEDISILQHDTKYILFG